MTAQNEDVPYNVSDFATSDEETKSDPDRSNESVLIGVNKYLEEAIIEHNTIDVVDLTEAAKMTPTQQIAVHKVIVEHLRNIKVEVSNKIEKLRG